MRVKLNAHYNDICQGDFTIEFEVKFPPGLSEIPEKVYRSEYLSGLFTNKYADEAYNQIKKAVQSRTWQPTNWCFTGRSAGWFALICKGEESKVTERQIEIIGDIVNKKFLGYAKKMKEFYD
jgi:hypothetical protein